MTGPLARHGLRLTAFGGFVTALLVGAAWAVAACTVFALIPQ